MPSQTDLCNLALALVAEQRITSINDDSEPARLCLVHLDQTIREVLRGGLWRCARKLATLTANAVPPAFGWQNAYPLPPDWLRMIRLNDLDPGDIEEPLWEIIGGEIQTDETTANISYIYDLTQTGAYNQLDAACTQAVYYGLAIKLCTPLQGQAITLKEALVQEFTRILAAANVVNLRDACEPLVNSTYQSRWIRQARSIGASM